MASLDHIKWPHSKIFIVVTFHVCMVVRNIWYLRMHVLMEEHSLIFTDNVAFESIWRWPVRNNEKWQPIQRNTISEYTDIGYIILYKRRQLQ